MWEDPSGAWVRADDVAARIAELEAEVSEARRRRDEWRKKAEGYDEVRLALREKVGEPWPPHMSRVLWAGIAADWRKRAEDAEAEVARLRNLLERTVYLHDDYWDNPESFADVRAALSPKEG
jgi:hypothetical protein